MKSYFDDKAKDWDKKDFRMKMIDTISDLIKKYIPINDNMAVMDFGCGTGLLGLNFIDDVRMLTFADTSEGMLREVENKLEARKNPNAKIKNLNSINSKPEKYDLIFSSMALHHIEDYDQEISNLANSLNKDGFLCICDLDTEDGSFHQEIKVPHNGFNRDDIKKSYTVNNLQVLKELSAFEIKRNTGNKEQGYTVFMIIGKKNTTN